VADCSDQILFPRTITFINGISTLIKFSGTPDHELFDESSQAGKIEKTSQSQIKSPHQIISNRSVSDNNVSDIISI